MRASSGELLGRIRSLLSGGEEVRLMEVCGTHTVSIHRHGLRALLPPNLRLLSGPGCPVCVTPDETIRRAIAISLAEGVTLATFGDMVRVPAGGTSLEKARAEGGSIRVIYSPLEALDLAGNEPGRRVVLYAVGFETTAPSVAWTVQEAERRGLSNFSLLLSLRSVLPAMKCLIGDESRIEGFLCPGHVSAVIGAEPYGAIAAAGVPCVIAGFGAGDILEGLAMLLAQRKRGESGVEVQYRGVVPERGNPKAMALVEKVFALCDAEWRGLGPIPSSGFCLRDGYGAYDAEGKFEICQPPTGETESGCRCGEVLKGIFEPPECPLFGTACTPSSPLGPCMVSSEGSCAAWHKYNKK